MNLVFHFALVSVGTVYESFPKVCSSCHQNIFTRHMYQIKSIGYVLLYNILEKRREKKTKTNYSENFEKNRSQKKRQTGCSSLNSGLGFGGWDMWLGTVSY